MHRSVRAGRQNQRTCWRTCHTMQDVSLEPEIRWMPQRSRAKHVTTSEGQTQVSDTDLVLAASATGPQLTDVPADPTQQLPSG